MLYFLYLRTNYILFCLLKYFSSWFYNLYLFLHLPILFFTTTYNSEPTNFSGGAGKEYLMFSWAAYAESEANIKNKYSQHTNLSFLLNLLHFLYFLTYIKTEFFLSLSATETESLPPHLRKNGIIFSQTTLKTEWNLHVILLLPNYWYVPPEFNLPTHISYSLP